MKALLLSILGFTIASFRLLAETPVDNPYAISHYVIERKVVDMTEFYDSIASELNQAMRVCVPQLNESRYFRPLLNYIGSKLPTDNESLLSAAESIVAYMESSGHPKASKARKDLSKGKLRKECGPVIEEYLRLSDSNAERIRKKMDEMNRMLDDLEIEVKDKSVEKLALNKGVKLLSVYDNVPNPLFNKHITLDKDTLAARGRRSLVEDWEWALSDELIFHEQSYPKPLKYHYFKNHPEFAVSDNNDYARRFIYNRDGQLARVVYMTVKDAVTESSNHDPMTFFYRMAWNANAHNVHSESAAVKHAIKVRAGLEGKTAAEKRQDARKDKAFNDALKSSLSARMKYGDSWRTDAIERKAVKKYLNTPGGFAYPEASLNWFRQIEKDYSNALLHPFRVERLDDITFKVTYVDDNYNSTFEGIYRCELLKPFEHFGFFLKDLKAVETPRNLKIVYGNQAVKVDTLPKIAAAGYTPPENDGCRSFSADHIDVKATYGSGDKSLREFVKTNFIWPSSTQKIGSVLAMVVIDRDGTPVWSDLRYSNSRNADFEAEILRLVAKMGKWNPALKGKRPVRSRVDILFNMRYGKEPDVKIIEYNVN